MCVIECSSSYTPSPGSVPWLRSDGGKIEASAGSMLGSTPHSFTIVTRVPKDKFPNGFIDRACETPGLPLREGRGCGSFFITAEAVGIVGSGVAVKMRTRSDKEAALNL